MNREKKELLKKYTPEQIKQLDANRSQQQLEDATNFPELYYFMYDSLVDISDRNNGISPMSKEFRAKMRQRYERGDYPERLHNLVLMELNLKHPEE
jgi:hypothetical protein